MDNKYKRLIAIGAAGAAAIAVCIVTAVCMQKPGSAQGSAPNRIESSLTEAVSGTDTTALTDKNGKKTAKKKSGKDSDSDADSETTLTDEQDPETTQDDDDADGAQQSDDTPVRIEEKHAEQDQVVGEIVQPEHDETIEPPSREQLEADLRQKALDDQKSVQTQEQPEENTDDQFEPAGKSPDDQYDNPEDSESDWGEEVPIDTENPEDEK